MSDSSSKEGRSMGSETPAQAKPFRPEAVGR